MKLIYFHHSTAIGNIAEMNERDSFQLNVSLGANVFSAREARLSPLAELHSSLVPPLSQPVRERISERFN